MVEKQRNLLSITISQVISDGKDSEICREKAISARKRSLEEKIVVEKQRNFITDYDICQKSLEILGDIW